MTRVNRTKNETGRFVIIKQFGDNFRIIDLSYDREPSGPVYFDQEIAREQARRVRMRGSRIYIAKLEATK